MASLDVSRHNVEEAKTAGERRVRTLVAVGERTVALYPGESRRLILRVYGPRGHTISIGEQGFPHNVASLEIAPRQARAPFSTDIVVSAKYDAIPGVYPWSLRIVDATENRVLGEEHVTLVVLPRNIPKTVASRIARLRRVYENYGIQVALWAALKTMYPNGASFSTVKSLYELLTGRRVSKGTVGGTLRVMVRKGLLEKSNGLYKPLDLDPKVTLSRVDLKRVRYPWQVLKPRHTQEQKRGDSILEKYRFSLTELPMPIRRAYTYARQIAGRHGPLAGFYFLLYSLLGVRQTGYLLLWLSGWFIVLEPKTRFAHHFYSWLLHWMLRSLGLEEGVYYRPNDREHLEAQRIAQQYVREIYSSHQAARRLHYMLWDMEYIWSDEKEIYTVKVYHYASGGVGVQVLDKTGREELYSENLRNELAVVEVYTALPLRHVDRRNKETYFHRPAGLF